MVGVVAVIPGAVKGFGLLRIRVLGMRYLDPYLW